MRKPQSVDALEKLGNERLSRSFYMREFLYSETAKFHGLQNIPDNPDLALEVGRKLCEELLEPLNATFGRVAIRSSYRSCEVNKFCNEHGYSCAKNESNFVGHIWDRLDADGLKGATACIALPWFTDRFEKGADWPSRSLNVWLAFHLSPTPRWLLLFWAWRNNPLARLRLGTMKSAAAWLGVKLSC
jgi:hypothetical protein